MSRPSSTILLILLAGVLGGCGDEAAEDPAPEFEEDRDLKARQLFVTASAKSRQDKIPYLERLIGMYPDSRFAPEAHLGIIQVLLHSTVGRADDALAKTRIFAHRHPTHPLVVEAWYWIALHWKDDAEKGPEIVAEWKAWLDETRGRDDLDDANFKAFLWLHSAYAADGVGDKSAAIELLDQASEWDVPDKNVQLRIAFRAGSYRAAQGKPQQARVAFEKALQLATDGAKGVSPQAIKDALAGLGSDGE